jgi:flagellar FliJ protein
MKKFNFRLQRVLEIKDKIREISKIELSKKASEYNIEVSKLNKLKEEKKNALRDMKNVKDLEILQLMDNYIVSNENLQKYKQIDIKAKEKPFKEALQKYLEKNKEVKVLEKLKENYYNNYIRESLKEEEKNIDDLLSSRRNYEV